MKTEKKIKLEAWENNDDNHIAYHIRTEEGYKCNLIIRKKYDGKIVIDVFGNGNNYEIDYHFTGNNEKSHTIRGDSK